MHNFLIVIIPAPSSVIPMEMGIHPYINFPAFFLLNTKYQ